MTSFSATSTSLQLIGAIRRLPKQERAAARLQKIVRTADRVIGEKGLTGATMTEIAQLSGTSIGAIYQYFPSKEMLIAALRSRCLKELDACLLPLAAGPPAWQGSTLGAEVANLLVRFSSQFPAYRHLFFSTETGFRNLDADARLLKRFHALFSSTLGALCEAEISAVTETALIIIKGLLDASVRTQWDRHARLAEEIRFALTFYLRGRSRRRADPDTRLI